MEYRASLLPLLGHGLIDEPHHVDETSCLVQGVGIRKLFPESLFVESFEFQKRVFGYHHY